MIDKAERELGDPGSSPEGSLESARVVVSSGMNGVALPAPGRKPTRRSVWRLKTPQVRIGDPAVPFELPRADLERRVPAEVMRLDGYLGQPVALVFGSYTCPRFRSGHARVEALARRFGHAVVFLFIYVREAHPVGARERSENRRSGIMVEDPIDSAARLQAACECARLLGIRLPVLVDGTDDRVTAAYGGWPNRLCLIGRAGTVRFQARIDDVNGLGRAIRSELGIPWWQVWV